MSFGRCKRLLFVDLADRALGGFPELFLGDTDAVLELSAVLIDDLHIFLGNR